MILRNLDIPATNMTSGHYRSNAKFSPNLQFFWPNFGKK